MSNLDYDQERFQELLVDAAGVEFSVEKRKELNAVLKQSAAARAFAARHMVLDARLSNYLAAESAERDYSTSQAVEPERLLEFPFQRLGWVAAVALISVWVISLKWRGIEPGLGSSPVAVVNSANRSVPFSPGDSFEVGDWIRFDHGRMAVRFQSGAKLAVEGPAEFQIVSDNGAEMIRGRATIRVPGKIKGFTLETPFERVVDLGTSFGVEVDQDATSISVFEGEIELRGDRYEEGSHKLSAGVSVRVESGVGYPLDIPYEVADYLGTWQVSFGVEAIDGDLRVSDPTERRRPGTVVDPNHLLLFPERESVILPEGFLVSAIHPGEFLNAGRDRRIKQVVALEAPRTVDSYLLQFNPRGAASTDAPRHFSGSLRFDRPIVGLLLSKELLDASDSLLALSESDFGGIFRRGINVDDSVVLDPDRRSLQISFDTNQGIDQIRVLVATNPNVE